MDKRAQATKAGLASGLARQTPELIWQKAEAIRLHTQLDHGLAAIARAIGRPRNVVRRFLMQSGVYKTGHRTSRRDYGEARGPWKYKSKPITTATHQRGAWLAEWVHVLPWDGERHWDKHPALLGARKEARRLMVNKYQRIHHKHPLVRLVRSMRLRTWKTITRKGGTKRLSWTRDLLGCDRAALLAHLQGQFKPGMCWDNYGKVWEVDHIRPCASFNLSDEQEQRLCFHYTNLQPLTVRENRTKHAKWAGTHTP